RVPFNSRPEGGGESKGVPRRAIVSRPRLELEPPVRAFFDHAAPKALSRPVRVDDTNLPNSARCTKKLPSSCATDAVSTEAAKNEKLREIRHVRVPRNEGPPRCQREAGQFVRGTDQKRSTADVLPIEREFGVREPPLF